MHICSLGRDPFRSLIMFATFLNESTRMEKLSFPIYPPSICWGVSQFALTMQMPPDPTELILSSIYLQMRMSWGALNILRAFSRMRSAPVSFSHSQAQKGPALPLMPSSTLSNPQSARRLSSTKHKAPGTNSSVPLWITEVKLSLKCGGLIF